MCKSITYTRYKKSQLNDNLDHKKLFNENFWKYCKTVLKPTEDKTKPNLVNPCEENIIFKCEKQS